jgi:hypothetical protein
VHERSGEPVWAGTSEDLAAARAVFERNLGAIQRRDRDTYLSCYLQSPLLARTGSQGFTLGYDTLAASTGSGWPDHFEGLDLRLTPVRDGLIYGTYRYRVRYGATEQTGLSERLFVNTPEGWKIAISTAFADVPGVPAPPRAIVGGTLVGRPRRPAGARCGRDRARRTHRGRGPAVARERAGGRGHAGRARDLGRPRARGRARALFADRLGGRPPGRTGPA